MFSNVPLNYSQLLKGRNINGGAGGVDIGKKGLGLLGKELGLFKKVGSLHGQIVKNPPLKTLRMKEFAAKPEDAVDKPHKGSDWVKRDVKPRKNKKKAVEVAESEVKIGPHKTNEIVKKARKAGTIGAATAELLGDGDGGGGAAAAATPAAHSDATEFVTAKSDKSEGKEAEEKSPHPAPSELHSHAQTISEYERQREQLKALHSKELKQLQESMGQLREEHGRKLAHQETSHREAHAHREREIAEAYGRHGEALKKLEAMEKEYFEGGVKHKQELGASQQRAMAMDAEIKRQSARADAAEAEVRALSAQLASAPKALQSPKGKSSALKAVLSAKGKASVGGGGAAAAAAPAAAAKGPTLAELEAMAPKDLKGHYTQITGKTSKVSKAQMIEQIKAKRDASV